MSAGSDLQSHYRWLFETMGQPIATAAELCALPHWFNDDLACRVMARFGNLNGNDVGLLLEKLKRLPFVYPYEAGGWRFEPSARAYLVGQLERRNHNYLELHRFVNDYLGGVRQTVQDSDSPEARELEWRIAYHLAPLDARGAVNRLHQFVDHAAETVRLADMKAVLDLGHEQARWLSACPVDLIYFEGRFAYARNDLKAAERCFATVWEQAAPSRMKAIAGHLLGVIWMRVRRAHDWLVRAVATLRESLQLLERLGDTHGQAQVLNSLGGALVRLGGREQLDEAKAAFQRSLQLGEKLGDDRHIAQVLNSLGGALVRLGGREQLDEAKAAFQRSLQLLECLGDRRGQAMVLVSLSVWAETAGDVQHACSYMEKAISLYQGLGLWRNVERSQRRLQRLHEIA